MLSSFWQQFLTALEKDKQKIPVIFSLLKQTSAVELTKEALTLGCENQVIQFYLQKNIEKITQLLKTHTSQNLKLSFIQAKKKKEKTIPPLLSFAPSKEDYYSKAGLNPKHTFESFAVSTTNQVAYAAAQAVSENPGKAYNPLFLYGGVGVGKTHLAQATARQVIEKDQEKRVYFCPGDHFTNEMIESIRGKTTPAFRRKYRSLDLLIIDDVQFIAGKNAVQEEFFHTFNSIVPGGGQIIMTSDQPPFKIKNLEDRLRSRFSGGLTVDIQPPDFELRTAILLIKAREKNIELDIEAAKIISEQVADSRALEGVLLSVYAKTLNTQQKIDLGVVEDFFSNKEKSGERKISPSDVIKNICSYYNLKPSYIKGPIRRENIAYARQIAMYLLRNFLKLKLEEVAYILKRKDHTTVMHGVAKISHLITKDEVVKKEIDAIIKTLNIST